MLQAKDFTTSDGTTYKITVFDGKLGLAWFTRIGKIIGPALGAAIIPGSEEKIDLASAVTTLAANINEAELERLCENLAAKCLYRVAGSEAELPLAKVYNDHFAGEIMKQLEWLAGCLEANYSEVFRLLRQAIKPPKPTTPKGAEPAK